MASAQLPAGRARLPTQFPFNVGCVADGGCHEYPVSLVQSFLEAKLVAKAHPTR